MEQIQGTIGMFVQVLGGFAVVVVLAVVAYLVVTRMGRMRGY